MSVRHFPYHMIFLWHNTHSPQYSKKRANVKVKRRGYLMVYTEMEQHTGLLGFQSCILMRFRNSKLRVLCDAKCIEGYEKKITPAQKAKKNGE
jgi:hypothetical protein